MSTTVPGRTARGASPERPAGQRAAADTCAHDARYETATPEGEIVCRACGVVRGEDDRRQLHADPAALPRTRTNLYLEMEVGGRPDRRLRADRFVRRRHDMVAVSNISQKLGIPNGAGRDVWAWYLRLRRAPGMRMTKAKILVLAFHGVCRAWGCPLNEARLRDAIRMELGVRNAHSYLRAIMEASSYVDEGTGEHVLRRTGFLDLAGRSALGGGSRGCDGGGGGARPPSPPPSSAFSISTEIQSLAREYGPRIAGELAREARSILPVLEQREPNRARAARAAIRIAKRRYGTR
ncbi:MAG: hypothetical protein OXP12_06505 [Thaumarchaeota archaeon]|nr:hypothetical protein [Nitrososphaerota archaeon]MDE0526383.1 hypothetical protein [Nitrososphaerota archaeon]